MNLASDKTYESLLQKKSSIPLFELLIIGNKLAYLR